MTRYTRDHEWVRFEDGVATVGITEHAQEALGDITYVELPAVGKAVQAGEMLCVIESVKAASDVFAPVAGSVASVNDALDDAPETLNESPEEKGWICTLSGVDASALEGLMTTGQYADFCRE